MLGATIPVFGSTFYKHSWLGVPVQWCGLVYAYHVFHLAEELEKAREDVRPPGTLNFSAADWKSVTELITVSGMHQQFADGDKIGSYPDSITRFERRNGAFLNPEDILVNVLALKGHDPDIKTVRVKQNVISSAARIENARTTRDGLRFDLEWFPNEISHTLIKSDKPESVLAGGAAADWTWDEKHQRVYVSVKHARSRVTVELRGAGASRASRPSS